MTRSPDNPLRIVLLVALVLLPGDLLAQQTSLSVTLPEVIVLHYFSDVSLSFDADEIRAQVLQGVGDAVDEGVATGVGWSTDAGIDPEGTVPAGPENPRLVPLVLNNAFAVRSLGGSGRTRITGTIVTNRANHPSTSSSRIIARQIRLDIGGQVNRRVTIDSPGLIDPEIGGILLALDLRNVRLSGTYSGITVQLSVENL